MNLADAIRQEMDCVVHDARAGMPHTLEQLELALALQERLEQLIKYYG
jgi:hypothetical protein